MRNDFAVLILSHGRADRVYTIPTLRKGGYTGRIYIVVDNEDEQQDEYIARYGKENVIVFDKLEAMKHSDTMDNYEKHNIVLYARNSCFEIAKRLGLSSFLELDDDYTAFDFRFEKSGKLAAKHCTDLDRLFEAMLDFLYESDSLVVALSQGGDYIGGLNGKYFAKKLSRKAMNAFFCRVDRPFSFFCHGRVAYPERNTGQCGWVDGYLSRCRNIRQIVLQRDDDALLRYGGHDGRNAQAHAS